MSLKCPKCGRDYDVTLFEYGREVCCPCGERISFGDGHVTRGEYPPADDGQVQDEPGTGIDWDSLEKEIFESVRERECRIDRWRAAEFSREADRIVSLILYSDTPRVDIDIMIRAFRERVLGLFPEKEELFDALYANRFRRIWEQFRDEEEPLA